jgi:hypothetical protein
MNDELERTWKKGTHILRQQHFPERMRKNSVRITSRLQGRERNAGLPEDEGVSGYHTLNCRPHFVNGGADRLSQILYHLIM